MQRYCDTERPKWNSMTASVRWRNWDERPSVHLFDGLGGNADGQYVVVHHQVNIPLADARYVRPDVEFLCEGWGISGLYMPIKFHPTEPDWGERTLLHASMPGITHHADQEGCWKWVCSPRH